MTRPPGALPAWFLWRMAFVLAVAMPGCAGGGGRAGDAAGADDHAPPTCGPAISVWIQGDVHAIAFDALPTRAVTVQGRDVLAVALTDVVSDAFVAPYSFDGMLTGDQVRSLYDYELAPAEGAGPVVPPETLSVAWYVPADRTVVFADAKSAPAGGVPAGLCDVRAHRRFVVRRDPAGATVHLEDLAAKAVDIVTPYGTEPGVPLTAIVDAAGVMPPDPATAFDYVLVPPDRPAGVRFPFGHKHFENMYWTEGGRRTRSTDSTGDLLGPDGTPKYGGVASAGWSTVKALLYIDLVARPDPAHEVSAPGVGVYTDPASCMGCHVEEGNLIVPVNCAQCHK